MRCFLILAAPALLLAQTIAIQQIDPVGILGGQASAITNRIRETAIKYCQTVDRGDIFQEILGEHALRQAGVTSGNGSLGLIPADQVLSGWAGRAGASWFIDLSLTDISTGEVLGSKHASVGSYKNLMTITKTVTKALLQGTLIEDDENVTVESKNEPLIIGIGKTIHEVHVYEHKPETHDRKRFIPCNFCGGRGTVPYARSPNGTKDCPACAINSSYKGPSTYGMFLTGQWR